MVESPKATNWRFVLEIAAIVVMLSTAGLLAWTVVDLRRPGETGPGPVNPPPRSRIPVEPISLEGVAVRGSRSAKFAVVEFGDYQCPACSRFAQTILPGFFDRYVETNQVLFAYRHLPLERIHPLAVKAAEAAECAGKQNRFWEMNEALYGASPRLELDNLQKIGKSIGLVAPAFNKCLDGQVSADVRQGIDLARSFKFSSVPMFVFGTVEADGRIKATAAKSGVAADPEEFYKLIDAMLSGEQRPQR